MTGKVSFPSISFHVQFYYISATCFAIMVGANFIVNDTGACGLDFC